MNHLRLSLVGAIGFGSVPSLRKYPRCLRLFFPPLLEACVNGAWAPHLPCGLGALVLWCWGWGRAGQRFRRNATLLNHACVILCLPCSSVAKLSTRRRRAPPAPWDISPAATWPCASPSPCTATASTTAGIRPTRRTAVSHRPLSVRLWMRGSLGRTIPIGLIEINDTLWLCNMCDLCFVCCKMQIMATVVLLLAHLNLLSLLLITCYSLLLFHLSRYFKHRAFLPKLRRNASLRNLIKNSHGTTTPPR